MDVSGFMIKVQNCGLRHLAFGLQKQLITSQMVASHKQVLILNENLTLRFAPSLSIISLYSFIIQTVLYLYSPIVALAGVLKLEVSRLQV